MKQDNVTEVSASATTEYANEDGTGATSVADRFAAKCDSLSDAAADFGNRHAEKVEALSGELSNVGASADLSTDFFDFASKPYGRTVIIVCVCLTIIVLRAIL